MKRIVTVFLAVVILLFPKFAKASGCGMNATRGVKCEYVQTYHESILSRNQEVQYTHLVYPGTVPSKVEQEVMLTSSLSLTSGGSVGVDFMLARSNVNFELSSIMSTSYKEKITWGPIPAGQRCTLRAGKVMITVKGTKETTFEDCHHTSESTTLKGTTATWHDSINY